MNLTINCYAKNLKTVLDILACDLELSRIEVFSHTQTGHPDKLFTVREYTLEIPDIDRYDEDPDHPFLSEKEYKTNMYNDIKKRFKRFKSVGVWLNKTYA